MCPKATQNLVGSGKTSCVCFTRVTELVLLARSAWTAIKEEGMGRAGWLGSTPRQRLDDALGWHGAHEAVREARRSYSIRSELQDTRSVYLGSFRAFRLLATTRVLYGGSGTRGCDCVRLTSLLMR